MVIQGASLSNMCLSSLQNNNWHIFLSRNPEKKLGFPYTHLIFLNAAFLSRVLFTVRYSQRGSLQTNNYNLQRGQTGEGNDDPGLLYHQPATEDLSQPSFTEHTGYMIHDESL